MKAAWITDYDLHTDKCFKRPGCPECYAPIGKDSDGKYYCFSCGKDFEVEDPEMLKWFEERSETKIVMEDCPKITTKDGTHISGCGGKKCVRTLYRKNPVSLKWEVMRGACEQCGMRFIV